MKKKILMAVFLLVVSFVGTKAFVALLAYQTMEGLKQVWQKDVSLTYSWISSGLDGSVVFHDLVITPYRLKRSFYVEQAELKYKHYADLLLSLPELKEGHWQGFQRLVLNPVRIPFEGRDLDELLALEYGDNLAAPLRVHGCGELARIGHNDLAKMGLRQVEGSLDIQLASVSDSENLRLSAVLDMNELGKLQLDSDWSRASIASPFSSIKPADMVFRKLLLSHIEGGYFRRLGNYCSGLTETDREHFSDRAAKKWRLALSQTGVIIGDEIEALYHDYLLRGGQLDIRFNPETPFAAKTLAGLFDQDLVARFGMEAVLNGNVTPVRHVLLDGSYFRPPEPLSEVLKKPQMPHADSEAERVRQFLPISEGELDMHLGREVRIRLKDEKQFQGELVSISEHKLEIAQLVGGGKVSYFLTRANIEQIEVYGLK